MSFGDIAGLLWKPAFTLTTALYRRERENRFPRGIGARAPGVGLTLCVNRSSHRLDPTPPDGLAMARVNAYSLLIGLRSSGFI